MSLRDEYVKSIRSKAMGPLDAGVVRWTSPSNIALVKYWGKHGNQLPINPSVSFTLSKCLSDTEISFEKKNGPSTTVDLEFLFENKPAPEFTARIKKYFESILDLCPFLSQYRFKIKSSNSFPHSAGIASSASGFSALALNLATIEDVLYGDLDEDDLFRKKASFLARLGSGSAGRSIFNHASWWGASQVMDHSSDDFAIGCSDILHPTFQNFQDSILIVSSDEKSVSSTAGHHLMEFHPYRDGRLKQAARHLTDIKMALQTGDLEQFGYIVESEALALHALMLSSHPGYFLINGRSIQVIEAIRAYRTSTNVPCYVTLDAGPNIHLLYPEKYRAQVHDFIQEELSGLIDHVIHDEMGNGPTQLA